MLDDLKKALAERILNSELDENLENEQGSGKANRRRANGSRRKTSSPFSSKNASERMNETGPSTRFWIVPLNVALAYCSIPISFSEKQSLPITLR